MTATMRKIDTIIVHCSDSWWGDAAVIDQWHKARGFARIGYHYVILNGYVTPLAWHRDVPEQGRDGEVQTGRELAAVGAHCEGHNQTSVGICLIGRRHFTGRQFAALRRLCAELRARFGDLAVLAHCELNPAKTCPNLNPDFVRELAGR